MTNNMIIPNKIKGIKPLYINKNNELFFSKGNSVFVGDILGKKHHLVGKYSNNILINSLSRINLFSRILRLGYHMIYPYQSGLIGIQRNNIIYNKKNDIIFKSAFSNFNGSRPLSLLIDPKNKVYFGASEYRKDGQAIGY